MTIAVETAPAPTGSHPQVQPQQFRIQSHLWLVLAITVVAGVLRFSFLDRPPIWGDEAMTYMRVSGTYQQMLDALREWGFAPLHYSLYWWIRQQTPLTPFMMRLPTAIAGTLMVPVMYWLAVQLTRRRDIALVTALFAATSAYLCNYSRDAKMYMDFWFFATLNFACLLWWLRVRTRIAWWCWVASGVAMLGLNLLGYIVLGIQLIALLIWPVRKWRPWIPTGLVTTNLFVVGLLIMSIGPIVYYCFFNQYSEKIERAGGLTGAGLQWIEPYNRGRDAMDLVLFTATAHLYSWEWPRALTPAIKDQEQINPRALRWLKIAGVTILCLLAAGLLPWRRIWNPQMGSDPRWPIVLGLVLAWIVLPAYAFYCMSVKGFASPPSLVAGTLFRHPEVAAPARITRAAEPTMLQRWSAELDRLKLQVSRENRRIPRWWQWMLIGVAVGMLGASFYLCGSTFAQRMRNLAILLGIILILLILCTLMFMFWRTKYSGSVWMPRYLGVVWPAVAIAVATLLLRLPTRPLRWAAIALLVGVNLAVFSARVFAGSEAPTHLMASDVIDSQPRDATVRMYYGQIRAPHPGAPGGGTLTSVPGAYYLTILSGQPTTPRQMIGSFGGGSFGRFRRWNSGAMPLDRYISRDLQQSPQIQRIIVWDKPETTSADENDTVATALGSNWRRIDQQIYPVRDHWTWRNLYLCRRRVYERTGPPTTIPSTQPAPATTQSS